MNCNSDNLNNKLLYIFYYIYSGLFDSYQPAFGLAHCQDFLCGIVNKDRCNSFIYNRLDDQCILYEKVISERPKCEMSGGMVQDNPSDCDDPEDKCQVS